MMMMVMVVMMIMVMMVVSDGDGGRTDDDRYDDADRHGGDVDHDDDYKYDDNEGGGVCGDDRHDDGDYLGCDAYPMYSAGQQADAVERSCALVQLHNSDSTKARRARSGDDELFIYFWCVCVFLDGDGDDGCVQSLKDKIN